MSVDQILMLDLRIIRFILHTIFKIFPCYPPLLWAWIWSHVEGWLVNCHSCSFTKILTTIYKFLEVARLSFIYHGQTYFHKFVDCLLWAISFIFSENSLNWFCFTLRHWRCNLILSNSLVGSSSILSCLVIECGHGGVTKGRGSNCTYASAFFFVLIYLYG